MRHFLTAGLAGVALLSAAGLGASRAETPEKMPAAQVEPMMKSQPPQAEPAGPTDNQIANDVDARIAFLKAGLRLTVEQEKNWPGLQTVLHDYGIGQMKAAMETPDRPRRRDRDDQDRSERPNDIALLREMADNLTARGASLKKLADAAEPLYASLDDRQKRDLFHFLRTDFELRRH
jgi:zinc resistance-associated protein